MAVKKALYGAAFVLLLPALLVAWAAATARVVHLPPIHSFAAGAAIAAGGALILLAGVAALWVYGRGLPMNAYPPPKHVSQGIYRLLPHPIYTGFCAMCVGASVAAGSASGLWLVSPAVMLGCAALVLGYERRDLEQRFGTDIPKPWLSLPVDDLRLPTVAERVASYFLALIPWVVLYQAVIALGTPPDAIVAYLPFENRIGVWQWTGAIYVSAYAMATAVPIVAKTRRDLRTFTVRGLLSMALMFSIQLVIPLISPHRPFVPHGLAGRLLAWEGSADGPGAAFPSFHVSWVLLAVPVFTGKWPPLKWVWRIWAFAIVLSCMTTGRHALIDLPAAAGVVALVNRSGAIWEWLRSRTERMANSWREFRFGPVRAINHGIYAGAGAFAAVWIVGQLTGPGYMTAISIAALAGLIGSGLWAQAIEGSPRLLRPFGFYGGLLGVSLGTLAAPVFGGSAWLLVGAFAAAAPLVQALGRLRCLVQGCCHGRRASAGAGYRYLHPQSRVCRLAKLCGVPIHATPLYSILWNIFVGMVVARLWTLHAPLHFIGGLYLILGGLGRFVEEAYRGEPQTQVIGGLRIYQWIAAAEVLAGALVTALGNAVPAPAPHWNWQSTLLAGAFAVVAWFALGVDFPESNRRFARLA